MGRGRNGGESQLGVASLEPEPGRLATARSLSTSPAVREITLIDTLAAPAVALCYFAAVALSSSLRGEFQLNPDEGINAIKSLLVARDYRLFTDIWSDQPPLFTHVLRAWFDLVGWDVSRGRLLILAFAALIVFAIYDLVRQSWSHRAALAAVLALVASTDFTTLSVSVMIGLPSIAFALMSAWAMVAWERTYERRWLAGSAVFMSLSLCIKLFTAFLIPTLGLWLLAVGWWRGRARPWLPAGLWVIVVIGLTTALLVAMGGQDGIEQLTSPHAAGRALLERFSLLRLSPFLLPDWPVLLLAVIGGLLILRARCWELTLLLAWGVAAVGALMTHAPIWLHHCQLIIVVASAAAGVAIDAALRLPRHPMTERNALAPIVHGAAILALIALVLPRWPIFGERTQIVSNEDAAPVLAALSQFAPYTNMIVTDTPMYAFRLGLAVAPELAVVSMKRLRTGNLNAASFYRAMRTHSPEQILLTRLPLGLHQRIAGSVDRRRYQLVYNTTGTAPVDLWVRTDILARAAGNGTTP